MTSDARARPQDDEDGVTTTSSPTTPDDGVPDGRRVRRRPADQTDGGPAARRSRREWAGDDGGRAAGGRPLRARSVPVLGRPAGPAARRRGVPLVHPARTPPSIRTADYVGALAGGPLRGRRPDVLRLPDARRRHPRRSSAVATGDLQKESIDQLDAAARTITDSQAVVNTKVSAPASPGPTRKAPRCCWSSSRRRRARRARRRRSCATGSRCS